MNFLDLIFFSFKNADLTSNKPLVYIFSKNYLISEFTMLYSNNYYIFIKIT